MTPESFNAALATRKLEAADILLIQAKTGSNADRIRAASAILRIAFMAEPKPQKGTPEPSVAKGAPESPQQSEEIPGELPPASFSPDRQFPAQISALLVPVCSRATVSSLVPVNSS